mmetsp:Transcript_27541/g.44813  ORF Transcript_27541/g.44813 Transcript_27541/m.44813 type:complete len:90 (-) Transcript_27541:149-418(-)
MPLSRTPSSGDEQMHLPQGNSSLYKVNMSIPHHLVVCNLIRIIFLLLDTSSKELSIEEYKKEPQLICFIQLFVIISSNDRRATVIMRKT